MITLYIFHYRWDIMVTEKYLSAVAQDDCTDLYFENQQSMYLDKSRLQMQYVLL